MAMIETGRAPGGARLGRREFLRLAGVGAGVVALGAAGYVVAERRQETTAVAPAVAPRAASTGRIREYALVAGPANVDLGDRQIATWGYNGGVPGPEIRLVAGDTLRATVRNALPQETTIHWHGIPLPNAMDGVPGVTQPAIRPGETFTYEFAVPVAGTYMYHSHAGLQLDRGLYGALIVEAPDEPLRYDREFVLVLDDWLDGLPGTPEDTYRALVAGGDRMGGMGGMGGMMGGAAAPPDVVYPRYLVNGRAAGAPLELAVRRGETIRLRIINPASATIFRVALAGHRLTVTHADGQPVEPVEVDALRIGMGERYDVLVRADNPGVWQFAAAVEGATGLARAQVRYDGRTDVPPPEDYRPPELSRQLLGYGMLKDATTAGSARAARPGRFVPVTLSGGMGQYRWTINGQAFPAADRLAVDRDRPVRFQLQNMSMMPHPLHLHGHFFRVDNGTGRGPLKDTVLIESMGQVAIDWLPDNPGDWAFHCHNLYHAEAGMMRVVRVG